MSEGRTRVRPPSPAARESPQTSLTGFPGCSQAIAAPGRCAWTITLTATASLLPVHGARMREEFIGEVELSALAGRGGAGFPTARKLAAVAARRNAVVIGNGTEGEPASAKDKVLMAQSPHLVLDGAAAAAGLVGATEAIVVAHAAVADLMAAALAERRRTRLDLVRLSVVPAADAFVAGEATAVVHWLENRVPKPTSRQRRLSERGLHGRPTLVQNVETLAHLALITRYGAAWFRAVGTRREPGSMLVTLAGAVRVPGVYEVEIGTPVGAVLDLAGGPARPARGAARRRILRHLGRPGSCRRPAAVQRRAGSSGRWPGRRAARGAARRRMRPGGDRQDRAVPRQRVGRPVRAVRLRPGRHRRTARAPRVRTRPRPGRVAPMDRAGGSWARGVQAP